MRRISYKETGLNYTFNPKAEPVARVKPGDTLVLETQDASSGQIRREGDVRDKSSIPFSNPVVGPIYVEGAEAGDSISVLIEEINPLEGLGITYFLDFTEHYLTGTSAVSFASGQFPHRTKVCRIEDGQVYLTKNIVIPYRPMVGVVAVAPHPEIESMSSLKNPGPHGGNMDIPDIRPGSKVFLPVFHSGGLLYVGDAHAAMGDGEITGVAVEMPAEIRIRIGLHKGLKLSWPRVETESELVSIVAATGGRELRQAVVEAYLLLSTWISEEYGIDRYDAFILVGEAGRVRIGNLWTAAAKIAKSDLDMIRNRRSQ